MELVFALVLVFLTNFGLAREMPDETSVQEILREVIIEGTANETLVGETLIKEWHESESVDEVEFTSGMVSQRCLQCICQMESGCRNVGCKMDVGSLSCGYFQIKYAYWIDCGKPWGNWKRCAGNKACASKCVQNYMRRYAKWAGCPLRCEGYAREHNGGPRGCKNSRTLGYWHRLQRLRGCHGVH